MESRLGVGRANVCDCPPFKLAFDGLRKNGQSITGTNVAEGPELHATDFDTEMHLISG